MRSATRERLDWRKVVAFATAIALLSSVQIGREGGLPRAVADVAGAAGDIGGTVIDSAFGQEGSQEAGSDGDASDEREPGVEPVFGTSDESGLPALPRASDAKAGGPAAGGDEGTPEVGNGALLEPLIAYYCAHEICVMTPDGTGRRSLTNSPTWEREPDWSPDGTKIVYTSLTDPVMVAGQEPIDLFVMDADGSGTARLTTDTRREGNPSWSPDGTTIAFDSREPESTDNLAIDYWITLVRADGTGGRQRIVRGTDPDWSPDGRWIVYNDPKEASVIRIVRPDGSKDQAITPVRAASAYGPEWSPDGRFIAFFAEVPDKPGFLSVLDLLTGRIDKVQVKKLGDCCPSLSWTPDGQHMLFTLEAGFYVIKPDGTGQRLLVRDPGGSSPTWRPNSQA